MDSLFQIGSVNFNIIDVVMIVICLVMAIKSCITGFIKEFTHTGGLVLGIASGFLFTKSLSNLLFDKMPSFPTWSVALISFLGLVLVGYILFRILGSALDSVVSTLRLNALDNILGFVWGLVFSAFVLSLIIYVLSLQEIFDFSRFLDSSAIVTRLIKPLIPETINLLKSTGVV